MGAKLGYTESSKKSENIDFQNKLNNLLNNPDADRDSKVKAIYESYGKVREKQNEMILVITETQLSSLGSILGLEQNKGQKFSLRSVLNKMIKDGKKAITNLENGKISEKTLVTGEKNVEIGKLKSKIIDLEKKLEEQNKDTFVVEKGETNLTDSSGKKVVLEKIQNQKGVSGSTDENTKSVNSNVLFDGEPIIPTPDTTDEKILKAEATEEVITPVLKQEVKKQMENDSEFATKVLKGSIGLLMSLFESKKEVDEFKKDSDYKEVEYIEKVSFEEVDEGYEKSLFFNLKKEDISVSFDDTGGNDKYNFGIKNLQNIEGGKKTYMEVKFPQELTIIQSIDLAIINEAIKTVLPAYKDNEGKILELIKKGDAKIVEFVKLVSEGKNDEAKKILDKVLVVEKEKKSISDNGASNIEDEKLKEKYRQFNLIEGEKLNAEEFELGIYDNVKKIGDNYKLAIDKSGIMFLFDSNNN